MPHPGGSLGVLALQGDFREHISSFAALGVAAVEVRTAAELARCSALVLPGGESTAQGLIAQRCGLLEPLIAFVASGSPVWGTCAGLVLLADRIDGASAKVGGTPQPTLRGLDCTVSRNAFGAQAASFEAPIEVEEELARALAEDGGAGGGGGGGGGAPRRAGGGIFIRAPAVTQVGPAARAVAGVVQPRGDVHGGAIFADGAAAAPPERLVVAVRQGNLFATAFHPELSASVAWHRYFVQDICRGFL